MVCLPFNRTFNIADQVRYPKFGRETPSSPNICWVRLNIPEPAELFGARGSLALIPNFGSGWFARLADRFKNGRWYPFVVISPTFNHTLRPKKPPTATEIAQNGSILWDSD
jgi:hypothetical protein